MTRSRESFERLVQDTRADLLAYALRRSGCAEDAADVVSDTYLIAWRKLERIPPGDQGRLWLFGVAGNVLRRAADRGRREAALADRLAGELREAQALWDSALDPAPSTRCLRAALASLPRRDQELLTLTAWEGLSPREIATVTGLPANLIRVRLHRARARLTGRLKSAGIAAAAPSEMHGVDGLYLQDAAGYAMPGR